MTCDTIVKANGGVMRVRGLAALGVSDDTVRRAVRAGELTKIRTGWVAAPDADADLVHAARRGVLLSCVTQARRLGLWTTTRDKPHVAATPHARPNAADCRVHWATPLIPRHPDWLEDPLLNVLQLVAACRPFEESVAVWNSALNARLTDIHVLEALPLSGQAVKVRETVQPFADSGLESLLITRLKWLGIRLLPQAHVLGRRVDLLIGERLVVQVDGATHTGPARDQDNEHDALLLARGYFVIRVGYRQVMFAWHDVQERILEAIAVGRHTAQT